MKQVRLVLLLGFHCLLTACAIKTPVNNLYKLDAFSYTPAPNTRPSLSVLISQPEAVAGYQTEQMLYINKPFELKPFVHNAWIGSPANMLFPLIIQSLQNTGYFYAVSSTPYSDKADYRLDTQLIELQQNFLASPSVIELVVKVVLTHIEDDRIIASRIINQRIHCPEDTPYGGVIAANQATKALTASLSDFVTTHVKRDIKHRRQ